MHKSEMMKQRRASNQLVLAILGATKVGIGEKFGALFIAERTVRQTKSKWKTANDNLEMGILI